MPSGCCSNCRSKYSLFNPENGCSSCAYSFCNKCVGYKAMMPRLADKPVSVCYACYQKLEEAKLKPSAIPTVKKSESKEVPKGNWWGEGLPPPSLRQTIGTDARPIARPRRKIPPQLPPSEEKESDLKQLEQKRDALKQDADKTVLSIPEIEERLAALRDCDVELIRNPKLWFASSASTAKQPPLTQGEQMAKLMEKARDQAALETEYDPERQLENRVRALKEDGNGGGETDATRLPQNPDFSTATPEELEKIQKLLGDAEKCSAEVGESLPDEEAMRKEMKDVMASSRQKSQEIVEMNARINKEMTGFWDKQINKTLNISDSEDDAVDDEMVKRIVAEAEATPDDPKIKGESEGKGGENSKESPKKQGFFSKLFRK